MLRRTLLLAFLVAGSAASHADEAAADKAASPAAADTAQVAAAERLRESCCLILF
jgi:hypothetical protein